MHRNRTSAEKRRCRSAGSQWRVGAGAAKVVRTNAYMESRAATRAYIDLWRETMGVHCPTATFDLASFRQFLTAQFRLLEQASQRSGPPVQELIRADEEHLSFRVLKKAFALVNSTTDSDSAAACSWDEVEENSPFGLPYVAKKTSDYQGRAVFVWRGRQG